MSEIKARVASKPIRLGSGKLYIAEHDDSADLSTDAGVIARIMDMEMPEKILGHISGGASVEYTKSTQTIKDDLELVSKTVITTEDVNLKSGVLTWNGTSLTYLCETCRVSDDPILGRRTIRIGGVENADGKVYDILFVHEDKKDGNVYVLISGKNTSGFKLDFKKDAATVIDATFTADALDETGTKLIIVEEIASEALLKVKSEEGTNAGNTKITVADTTLSDTESYAYKFTDMGYLPCYLSDGSNGYTKWDGKSEIAAESGKYIVVAVANAENKIIKAGAALVVAKAAD